MKRFISYTRLSKKQKNESYYGLEAQRNTINDEINRQGGVLLQEYTELESGTSKNLKNRTEIFKALNHAKNTGATIIVAKLDRLARDTQFLLSVMSTPGVEVLFCDFKVEGVAGRMLITMMSAFAEYETARISDRTKAGLAIAKARGVKLGNPHTGTALAKIAAAASVKSKRENYHETPNMKVKTRIEIMQREGKTVEEIAAILNGEGCRSTMKQPFSKTIIERILKPAA